jgi:hypothetical protein
VRQTVLGAIGVLFVISITFFTGCMFVDPIVVILVLVPIFAPVLNAMGLEPVHVGAITVLQVAIGSRYFLLSGLGLAAFQMHRTEPARPQYLCNAARIGPVGLVANRRQRGIHLPGLHADHVEARLLQTNAPEMHAAQVFLSLFRSQFSDVALEL